MSASKRMGLHGFMSLLGIFALACGDGATAPAPRATPANRASVATANLAVNVTGRIVYTAGGTIHIYNLATNTDVSLGVSGVNPKFSPDGTLITCQCSGIKVMNADGTNQRVLAATGGVPSFDPTGTKIVFTNNGVWTINVDGTGLTQLTADDGHWAAWSPDGTQIAYGASAGSVSQLFIMNADGTNRHQALTSGAIIDVVWSPSTKILFGLLAVKNNYELYSYDPINAASLTRLTNTRGNDFEPSWSPDATGISWTSGSGGIWLMNADGTGKQGPIIPKGRQGSWGR